MLEMARRGVLWILRLGLVAEIVDVLCVGWTAECRLDGCSLVWTSRYPRELHKPPRRPSLSPITCQLGRDGGQRREGKQDRAATSHSDTA